MQNVLRICSTSALDNWVHTYSFRKPPRAKVERVTCCQNYNLGEAKTRLAGNFDYFLLYDDRRDKYNSENYTEEKENKETVQEDPLVGLYLHFWYLALLIPERYFDSNVGQPIAGWFFSDSAQLQASFEEVEIPDIENTAWRNVVAIQCMQDTNKTIYISDNIPGIVSAPKWPTAVSMRLRSLRRRIKCFQESF